MHSAGWPAVSPVRSVAAPPVGAGAAAPAPDGTVTSLLSIGPFVSSALKLHMTRHARADHPADRSDPLRLCEVSGEVVTQRVEQPID